MKWKRRQNNTETRRRDRLSRRERGIGTTLEEARGGGGSRRVEEQVGKKDDEVKTRKEQENQKIQTDCAFQGKRVVLGGLCAAVRIARL